MQEVAEVRIQKISITLNMETQEVTVEGPLSLGPTHRAVEVAAAHLEQQDVMTPQEHEAAMALKDLSA